MSEEHKCGFVAVIGRPNVGKSTLVNALLGEKVAIVSHKPQTTRSRIHGILNPPNAQIVLVDTPGLTTHRSAIHQAMRRVIQQATADADVVLLIASVEEEAPELSELDQQVIAAAKSSGAKLLVALNKIDQVRRKELLLPWIEVYANATGAQDVVPISALRKDGIDLIVKEIVSRLPAGPAVFPTDIATDQAERFLCAEFVREQVLHQTQQEVPHSVAVEIEEFEDLRDRKEKPMCRLMGRIIVERNSQKAILVGKAGSMIKSISEAARKQIEPMLGCQVFLRLTVVVDENWTSNPSSVQRYGIGSGGQAL